MNSSKILVVMKRILFLSLIISVANIAQGFNGEKYITIEKKKSKFTISENGKASPLLISNSDFPGVHRVVKHLQFDIANVTNAKPEILTDNLNGNKEVIIIGTIGKNPVIDQLIKEKKLNVNEISGKWETYLITTIEKPLPNVDRALIIAGSDKRGTIFGMYDLSNQIGVSPWYWWADVPVKKQNSLYVLPGNFSIGEPKVKYRGIFINDEAPALTGWVFKRYGGFNSKFYEHVFELILRMKGNFLWPAMWGRAFYDDDPENPRLADEYGVVIGTSHHEPMMRAHDEWRRYGKGGKWNYEKNKEGLQEFWRDGIKSMGDYESIVTLAMRGDGDEAMSPDANLSLLENIVNDQREILTEVTGKEITQIPQVWALYKEVQEYYDKGMRVPDDVTLLLCDDNWGNIRILPDINAKPRKGGYGMYYHYDFVGGPRNYKWLNTNPLARIWEQMHLTYRYGVDRIWIVNVGDIKPMEFPIEFFLDFAWNPDNLPASKLLDYTLQWVEKQFGNQYSKEIAEIVNTYTKFNGRRKPEMMNYDTYSLTDYKEFENVVDEFNELTAKAQCINDKLPKEYRDAFFQLVLHPTSAMANLYDMYLSLAKNYLYESQGRVSTNHYAAKVAYHFNKDTLITDQYNKVIAKGKWAHMMDQSHIGYTSWQQPERNIMPKVKTITPLNKADMGVAIWGSTKWFNNNDTQPSLPVFDVYNKQKYYIDVFNRGNTTLDYEIETSEPWILIDSRYGRVETDKRIFVSIDWNSAPKGGLIGSIIIKGSDNKTVTIKAIVENFVTPAPDKVNGFVESNGYISIEAGNYTKAINSNGISWLSIPNFGKTGSGVTPLPVTSPSQTIGKDSPRLEYLIHFFTQREVTVKAYFAPTQNFKHGTKGLHYAISFDEETPQIINVHEKDTTPDWKYPREWNEAVSNKIKIITSKHTITNPGEHTLKFWMIDPGLVLQKIVIDTGGLKPSYLGPPQSYNRSIK